ncbi:MAG TPA: hypothetical protein VEB18_00330 [Candidatus Paceibacterota bacterium]|nr:hypothetical protein [Candidatus Paceibacterota bacterium]
MDEITIDGKTYISSKRAAAIAGYAKDYIGQLCREGRVEARLIGRSWYVHEPSLRKHRFDEEGAREDEIVETKEEDITEKTNIEATWEAPIYTPEEIAPLPQLREEEQVLEEVTESTTEEVEEVSVSPTTEDVVGEKHEEENKEWESWFSKPADAQELPLEDGVEEVKEEEVAKDKTEQVIDSEPAKEEKAVPLHIIQDMQPKQVQAAPQAAARSPYGQRRTPQESNLVMKAALLSAMLIFVSVAVIGSGLADRFTNEGGGAAVLLNFFGGVSHIE